MAEEQPVATLSTAVISVILACVTILLMQGVKMFINSKPPGHKLVNHDVEYWQATMFQARTKIPLDI